MRKIIIVIIQRESSLVISQLSIYTKFKFQGGDRKKIQLKRNISLWYKCIIEKINREERIMHTILGNSAPVRIQYYWYDVPWTQCASVPIFGKVRLKAIFFSALLHEFFTGDVGLFYLVWRHCAAYHPEEFDYFMFKKSKSNQRWISWYCVRCPLKNKKIKNEER